MARVCETEETVVILILDKNASRTLSKVKYIRDNTAKSQRVILKFHYDRFCIISYFSMITVNERELTKIANECKCGE